MRSNKLTFLLFIALVVIFTESCKKSFFTNANTNNNAVLSVSKAPSVLLSTVEGALGYTLGGDMSRFATTFMQQDSGLSQQSAAYYKYGCTSGDFDDLVADLYTSTMENDYTLMKIADQNQYNGYSGVSRILMAYTLQNVVDCWGPMPYSQSFQANLGGTVRPIYDNDKALYDTITNLIDVAITQLNNPNQGLFSPGSEDVIYGGDVSEWIKFAHAIKARLYIHQAKGNTAMAANALAQIDSSFSSLSDDAQYVYFSSETTANPWYQFNRDRPGYLSFVTGTLAKNLKSASDPRYPILIDTVADFAGSYYASVGSPTEFICYDELLFVQAEATLISTGNYSDAQNFYQAAITANMTKLGISPTVISSYIGANGTLPTTSVNDAIAKVSSQEFIALFLNPEMFTLWRRNGVPSLIPVTGAEVPRRFLYSNNEIVNNPNTPSATLYTPKVFWDN
jgi:hypothetical protein